MLTFTKNGKKVLVANEGEPNGYYTVDPEGSVTIIDLKKGVHSPTAKQVTFEKFNKFKDDLIEDGVRIFGPNASVAQDLEPEYIAIGPYGKFAYVALQENNAIAVINIKYARCERIYSLGLKDHSLAGNALDASNKDDMINITNWPVFGMYQPDAIAAYKFHGLPFLVTANEGGARDYDGYSEEARIKDLSLDTTVFDKTDLQDDENLGRLKTTTALAETNEKDEYTKLFSYGARSFSIFSLSGHLIYDSGDDFETIIAEQFPDDFNSTNDENDSFDNRSDDKGPEPEALALGKIKGKTYAFIGLERMGGIMMYDITNPFETAFVTYTNNRHFSVEIVDEDNPDYEAPGDLGVEGIVFVSKAKSPINQPLLITSNEVSSTVTIFKISE